MSRKPLLDPNQWTDLVAPTLLGAITTGNIWQFGVLHRNSKEIEQGLNREHLTFAMSTNTQTQN